MDRITTSGKRTMRQFYELLRTQYEVTIESQATGWMRNLRLNAPYVRHDIREFRTGRAETCVIFGAGASLLQWQDQLRALRDERFFVVASPTVVPWLKREARLEPDLVVAVDAHDDMRMWLSEAQWRGPVFVPTYGNPGLAKDFPCYWFNISTAKPGYHPVLDAVITTQYPELLNVPSLGHVTGAALQLMMLLTDAGNTAFKRFVLAGADYAYWQGRARIPLPHDNHVNNVIRETLTIGGMVSDHKMPFYKERMLTLLRANPHAVYALGGGLLDGDVATVTLDAVMTDRWPHPKTLDEKVRAHERYLLQDMPQALVPALIMHNPWWRRAIRWITRGAIYGQARDSHGARDLPVHDGSDGSDSRDDARDSGLSDRRDRDGADTHEREI